MPQTTDFLTLVLQQLTQIKDFDEFKEKTLSLFKLFPAASRENILIADQELLTISEGKKKDFLEKQVRGQWYKLWSAGDFQKKDEQHFKKHYGHYTATEQKKLWAKAQEQSLSFDLSNSNLTAPPNKTLLAFALKKYKVGDYEPLRDYIKNKEKFTDSILESIFITIQNGELFPRHAKKVIPIDWESVCLLAENQEFVSRHMSEFLINEYLLTPPTIYQRIRPYIVKNTEFESISDTYEVMDHALIVLINLAIESVQDLNLYGESKYQLNEHKYLNALENFEYSFKEGDLPDLEKKVKKMCARKGIKDYKENVVSALLNISPTKKVYEEVERYYETHMPPEEFLQKFQNLSQTYVDQKKLNLGIEKKQENLNKVKPFKL